MEVTGKMILINQVVSGDGRNGTWKKQDFVIETNAQYPKKICFTLWGDKIEKLNAVVGDTVVVSFDVESKEYNGKWFTEARAWMIKKETKEVESGMNIPPEIDTVPFIEEDDLPF